MKKKMTIREAKLIGFLMRSTEKHKGARSHGSFGINVPCECTECKFISFVWANFIWVEDLEW